MCGAYIAVAPGLKTGIAAGGMVPIYIPGAVIMCGVCGVVGTEDELSTLLCAAVSPPGPPGAYIGNGRPVDGLTGNPIGDAANMCIIGGAPAIIGCAMPGAAIAPAGIDCCCC